MCIRDSALAVKNVLVGDARIGSANIGELEVDTINIKNNSITKFTTYSFITNIYQEPITNTETQSRLVYNNSFPYASTITNNSILIFLSLRGFSLTEGGNLTVMLNYSSNDGSIKRPLIYEHIGHRDVDQTNLISYEDLVDLPNGTISL